ncbi:MAG: Cys-Gln thioester bond-forming surface protein [Oscillospiraceae bacterium]|jgi:hypothetical protein|nr:Cys-Gln thioester bond-forming surface protein [Oscillospiraceae bacterium]
MRKLIAIILSAVMFISITAEIALAANSLEEAMEKVSLYKKSDEHIRYISPYGTEAEDFYAIFVVHRADDGTELPAYCINPNKKGVGGSTGIVTMDVDIDSPITDHAQGLHILGAIANGYPNKTPTELGLQSEYEAFSATKYAIWIMITTAETYKNPNNWQINAASSDPAACQRVLDAMRQIYAAGMATTTAPTSVKATAMWGKSYNEETQDYVVTTYKVEVEPTPTPTPTPPIVSDPPPVSGGLKILKYDNVTSFLVPGALFEVRGIDPTNNTILFQVQASAGAALPGVENGAIVETSNGQISVRGLPLGKYQITELSPPPNYDVSPNDLNPKIVEVQAESDASVYPQAIFRNNPFGRLLLTKIDAVTGAKVPGIWLRIRNPITGFDVTRQTNSGGIIELGDLPQGNYEVSEVNSGSDYELSDKVLVVPIRWGEVSEAVFNNEPHTSLELSKISAKTNTPVAGAVFKLTELSTGAEWMLTTLSDGRAVQNNIPAGNYTVQEIFVPEPLILDTTVVNIQVDNNKVNKFTFKNDSKPTVTLEKYDEKTGELIGGAEFRLEQLDGVYQTEFMLDTSGKRTFTVNPGTYRFTEIAAPWGYLIATESKEFAV